MLQQPPQPYPACIQHATYKNTPEDFQVHEVLGFEPTGEGEHLLLHIEKRGANTGYIAAQLAKWAGIASKHIGTCGMKDRHAVTRQWFSLWLPQPQQREITHTPFTHDEATVLSHTWHQRKLPTGAHQGNLFRIVLRDVEPTNGWETVEDTLQTIAAHGVPNYFGEQRFGHNGNNIEKARAWFQHDIKVKKQQQGILLSAARAAIFNTILAARVEEKTWNQALAEDIFNLNATNSVFTPENGIDEQIMQRCAEGDIHPTGALWGTASEKRKNFITPTLEQHIANSLPVLRTGLEMAGMAMARRSLRVIPREMQWQCDHEQNNLTLSFTLPKGSYATSILAALGTIGNASPPHTHI